MTKPRGPCTLAARLLEEVLRKSDWEIVTLAPAIDLTETQLDEYRSGPMRMPVQQQRTLAEFVLRHIPQCARTARCLASQAIAEAAFLAKETTTHMAAPTSRFGW